MNGELTETQLQQLLECHDALRRLEAESDVPAVTAAVRAAAVELRTALDGQTLAFDFFGRAPLRTAPAEVVRRAG